VFFRRGEHLYLGHFGVANNLRRSRAKKKRKKKKDLWCSQRSETSRQL